MRLTSDEARRIMVSRFLSWRIPSSFSPDGGISFDPSYRSPHGPTGTNLLDAVQATQMVDHMLAGVPDHDESGGGFGLVMLMVGAASGAASVIILELVALLVWWFSA